MVIEVQTQRSNVTIYADFYQLSEKSRTRENPYSFFVPGLISKIVICLQSPEKGKSCSCFASADICFRFLVFWFKGANVAIHGYI